MPGSHVLFSRLAAKIDWVDWHPKSKTFTRVGRDPTVQTISNGSYTLTRPLYLVTKGNVSPQAQKFIAFVLSNRGQKIMAQKGFIPAEQQGR